MGDWSSIEYIISQSLVVIFYIIGVITFNTKSRRLILSLLIVSCSLSGAAYFLLDAWAGFGITIIALSRNIVNLVIYSVRSEQKRKCTTLLDWILICVWCAAFITVSVFTFDGILSLFPLVATLLFTFATCQNNILVFKSMSIPCSICWITYSIYIKNFMGYMLEGILLIAIIVGLVRFVRNRKVLNANTNAA